MFLNRIAAVSVVGVIAIAGCGTDKDATVNHRDTGSADILNFPNHFNNVAMKCDGHGHRVFVTNNNGDGGTGSGAAVIADASCGPTGR